MTPKYSAAPPFAIRKPVLTSSKIRSAPNSFVSARISWWKPSRGRIAWALPRIGSTMTAAMSSPSRSKILRSTSMRLNRAGTTVFATCLRDAAAPRQPDRVVLVAELGHVVRGDRDQGVVVDAVVLALELHDLGAAGVAAGDAHRVHRRLGAGHGHPGLADPAGHLLDELHRLDLVLRGEGEADAAAHPLVDVVVDPRVAVARGSPARSPCAGRCTRCRPCPRSGRPRRDRCRRCRRPRRGSSNPCRRASS